MYTSDNEVSSDMENMEYDDIMITHTAPLHPKKRLERLKRIKKIKQEINNAINLVVYLIVEGDDDEVQTTGQTPLHPRNRFARLEKLQQIKDDLDKEIEYIVIDGDEN